MQQTIIMVHRVATLIPYAQYAVTVEHREAFEEALGRLEIQLGKCPKIGETDGMKERPAMFHYFYGGTDMYICEFARY
jgi:hypothetical protein